MTKILTANDSQAVIQAGSYENWVSDIVGQRWGGLPNWQTEGEARPAFILRSTWTVACDVCKEQIIHAPGEGFFCPNCCNSRNHYRARPVLYPSNRAAIEALLVRRADPLTRNWWPDNAIRNLKNDTWYPGETFRQLLQEQVEHGEVVF